ncbi:hypothetical protein ACEPPN_007469 [Leptodophora sp. 'Broadleaf-Isolate-01']
MALADSPRRTIAPIHNTALPCPLNVLNTAIAEYSKRTYFTPNIPANYRIEILDLADYNLPSQAPDSDSSPKETNANPNAKTPAEWEAEIAGHSGLILLFPYHTWSHCTPLKSALSTLSPHLIHTPTLLLGFGKEDAYHAELNRFNRTWKRVRLIVEEIEKLRR